MWIRNQDSTFLIYAEKISLSVGAGTIFANGEKVGSYSTREKAQKVLKKIEQEILLGHRAYAMPEDRKED